MKHPTTSLVAGTALVALLACATEPPAPAVVESPVEISLAGEIPVLVAGEGPYRFGLDTGQSVACALSRALADELALEVIDRAPVGDGSGENALTVDLVTVPRLEFGGLVYRDVIGIVMEQGGTEAGDTPWGVLGSGLFAESPWTIELANERLLIGGAPLPAPGGGVVEADYSYGTPSIEIEVAGHRVPTVIDSGSPEYLTLPNRLLDELPFLDEPQVVGRMATLFNEMEITAATLDGELRIGDHRVANPRLKFHELMPDGLLGRVALRELTVTFDPLRGRARITPAR